MLGWMLITIFGIGALVLLCFAFRTKDYGIFATCLCFGITMLIVLGIAVSIVYHRSVISIPEQYITYEENVKQIQDIITNTSLNLADLEMHKELAHLIRKRNYLLMQVRINNKSPWSLYKPIFLDKEIK